MAIAVSLNDPLPTFLHDSHEAHMETWTKRITDVSQEAVAVAEARDAVKQLVAAQVDAAPGALWGSPIATYTEDSPAGRGLVVDGQCVYLTPC